MSNLLDLTEKTSFTGTEQMYCIDGTGATNDKRNSFTNFFTWLSNKVFNGLSLKDSSGSYSLRVSSSESLTANRTLGLTVGTANRTLALEGDLSVSGDQVINQDVSILSSPQFYQPQLNSDTADDLTLKNISTAVGSLSFDMQAGDRSILMNGDLTVSGDCEVDQNLTQTSAPKFQDLELRYAATSQYLTLRNGSPSVDPERLELDMKGAFRTLTMSGSLDVKAAAEINQNVLTTSTPTFDGVKDVNGVQILNDQQAGVTAVTGLPTGTDKLIIEDLQEVVIALITRLETHGLIAPIA